MEPERHLAGVEPSTFIDDEVQRLVALLAPIADDDPWWAEPSRCEGWSRLDVVAHLAANEEYHAACREGTVPSFLAAAVEAGVTSVDGFNDLGIQKLAGTPASELLATWQREIATTSAALRERGDGTVDSTVGPYPALWQAAHIAIEVATHADDVLGGRDADDAERWAWRAQLCRFLLEEHDAALQADAADGGTRVTGAALDALVDDRTFAEIVVGRGGREGLAPEVAAALDTSK
jgi:uncharacterized protein (TIGR03083 family)